MIPIPTKNKPVSVLIVAEQILIAKKVECPICKGAKDFTTGTVTIPCVKCKGEGTIESETETAPRQPLTEADLDEFYNRQEKLLAEYGFKADHYGEKESMIKRLTTPKPESEYGK